MSAGGQYRHWIPGADWRHPQGPDSSINGKDDHLVVHVCYHDALAYAEWVGKVLLTEAEWEFAARGGLESKDYAWGDTFTPDGRHMANTWQGEFPYINLKEDGFGGTSHVGAFPPNAYGLLDIIGNVWEWTTDFFEARHTIAHACCTIDNPLGGKQEHSYDQSQPEIRIPRRVLKGGSHLCAPNYCRRYRPAARMPEAVDTGTSHTGFRCIVRIPSISNRPF